MGSSELEFPIAFGRYVLLEEVGRGGMGVIYRARQEGLDRAIALKMLIAGEFADAEARKRLLREAKAVARLSHPNMVAIHEVAEHEGRPFFAMEFVAGRSLAQLLEEGPLAVTYAADLVRKLALAVHYGHEQGVIHRDLKPGNVLVNDRGEPKLTDFGLTKLATDLTQTVVSSGSPNFMAPELASRELGPSGVHTDVFGLGAILYSLLTGRPPFAGEMLGETIRAVLEKEPAPPRTLRRDLPPDLETICLKCLRKVPAERYRTALEVGEDLERFLKWEPIRARRIGPLGRFVRWSRRNPALASLLVTAILALITVTLQWRRAKAGEYAARQNAYAAHMLLAQQRYESLNVGGALELLNDLRPNAGEPDFRGFEWGYLYRLCHSERAVIPTEYRDVHTLSFSPDGKYLVAGSSDWPVSAKLELQLLELSSGRTPSTFSTGELHFAFSPDGKLIASVGAGIFIRDFPAGTIRQVLRGSAAETKALAFSPDRQLLASAGTNQMITLWNLATGLGVGSFPANTNRGVFCLAWKRDGSVLYTGGDDNLVHVIDASNGNCLKVLRGHTQYVYCMALSPDGRLLATAGGDGHILLWDTSTGELHRELRGHTSAVYGLAFSPDGLQLASASWDSTVRVWNLPTDEEARILRGLRSFAFAVAYSPDGKTVAAGGHDGTIRLWNANRGSNQAVLRGASAGIGSVTWWPQADWLLTSEWVGGNRNVFRIWDVRKEQPVRSWESLGIRKSLHGERVFLPSAMHSIVAFNPSTGVADALPGAPESLADLRYSPDGNRMATVDFEGEAKVWASFNRPPVLTSRIEKLGPGADPSVRFSPDSRWFIMTSADATIQIWDARTGRLRTSFARGPVPHIGIEVSPDSRLLLSMDGQGYTCRELETGRQTFVISKSALHPAGCFSPDSLSLVTAHDSVFDVRDTRTGRILHTLRGHHGSALVSTFSPDGGRIATAGDDHTIKIWDPQNGRELLSLPGHPTEVYCLAFSGDGRHLASGGRDQTVRIWTIATDAEIAAWERRDRKLGSAVLSAR